MKLNQQEHHYILTFSKITSSLMGVGVGGGVAVHFWRLYALHLMHIITLCISKLQMLTRYITWGYGKYMFK